MLENQAGKAAHPYSELCHWGPRLLTGTTMDFKLPAYEGEEATTFFSLVDATFAAYEVTDEPKKFLLTMGALTPELRVTATRLFELEPATRYEELKKLIIEKTKKPENQRIQQLLNGAEIGDRRPSDYLHYLRQLMGEKK